MGDLVIREKEKKEDNMYTYIPVSLCTKGRLYTPETIEVRNFLESDLLKISMTTNENLLKTVVTAVQNCIKGDVDAKKLHTEELLEIILSIYNNFWNSKLNEIPYPLEKEDIDYLKEYDEPRLKVIAAKEEVPCVNINIEDITFKEVDPKVKPEYSFVHNGIKHKFKMLMLEDILFIENYIRSNFRPLQKEIKDIRALAKKERRDVSEEEQENISSILEELQLKTIAITRAISLIGIDDRKLDFEQSLKLIEEDKVESLVWRKQEQGLKGKYVFGHDPCVIKVDSPILGKPVERRFSFRLNQILQTFQLPTDDGFDFDFD